MVKVKLINESRHQDPSYATCGSAGMDLRASIDSPITIHPMGRVIIPTGIRIELPEGYEAQVRSRSGLAAKSGIAVLNSPGTIDSDFRGVIGVILVNLSESDFIVNDGDRIAQMIVCKYEKVEFEKSSELSESGRGEGGFGHTGVSDESFFHVKEGWHINSNAKIVESIRRRIDRNDGECPCHNPGKTREERLCPCKEYMDNDVCHCSLYIKD